MGFNIATARLGDKTVFLSARPEAPEWTGVEIDFETLTKSGIFRAPVVRIPKQRPQEHGTRVIVSRLRPGIFAQLSGSAIHIRKTLEDVYAPILTDSDIEIRVQSKVLSPRQYCVWDGSRYVSRGGQVIPARIPIDVNLGERLFNVRQNRYLTLEEEDEAFQHRENTGALPEGIISRARRICGWLGIQRYADTDDFGIDFVRNGRKILIRDKSLFQYNNPITGASELEYPVELGATVGGRIVGQIHIDHVPPTYQKNDFDRTDLSWAEVVETLRGSGPILPKKRTAMGFHGPNESPLGKLVNAYRRTDPGTRNLAISNSKARDWATRFYRGESEYISDDKWWKAAQEADRDRADSSASSAPAVDPGVQSSDDPSEYAPPGAGGSSRGAAQASGQSGRLSTSATGTHSAPALAPPDTIDDLKSRSTRLEGLSGDYSYRGCPAPLHVTVWEVVSGEIAGERNKKLPCVFFKDGNDCDFFYDPRHPFVVGYQTTFRDLLALYLAERFKVRDNLSDIADVFSAVIQDNFPESRLDQNAIRETAKAFFDTLREKMIELLAVREREVIDCVHESAGEVEETMQGLIANHVLLREFQSRATGSIAALSTVPARTLVRLVDRFPEELFDGKLFRTPYSTISGPDPNSTERLRSAAKDRILSYLKDALSAISEIQWPLSPHQRKGELLRCDQSLRLLKEEVGI